jgi:hypothetical protein
MILQDLGIPEGPFDPVLTQGVSDVASTPPLNKVVNDPTGEDVSIVQSEVAIAVRGDTIVVGWNDGIIFAGGSSACGYGYSVDRGETWTDGGEVPNGPDVTVWGDPTVIVTNEGEWVFMSIGLGTPRGLAYNRARFIGGALIWDPAEKYSEGAPLYDKEWLEYDPTTDTIYLTYRIIEGGRFSSSTDGGRTWSTPFMVATGENPNGFYSAPGIDGEVYVSWVDPILVGDGRLFVRCSSDGGQSWSADPVEVAQLGPMSAEPPQCFGRNFNPTFPAMSVDRSDGPNRGRAYLVYTDGEPDGYDAFATYSDDNGLTWAPPMRLNDNDNLSEQFWPQIHVGPFGRVSVTWFDRRHATNDNSLCDLYVTQSVDGGGTWGPNRRVSDTSVAWCGVPANTSGNFGDYIEVTSDDRSVFAVWSDARLGGPDVLFARYDDRHLLAVSGHLDPADSELTGAGAVWLIPNEAEFTVDPEPELDTQAQLLVASIGMGTVATPPETDGIFLIGGEALSGEVQLHAPQAGSVNGSFSVVRTGSNTISLEFTAMSSQGLEAEALLPTWTMEATLVDGGAGQVNVFGTVAVQRPTDPLVFDLSGTIHLDGEPGAILAANQSIEQTASANFDPGLIVHTRTLVEHGITIDVEELIPGTNPPPLATVGATPNPLTASTHVAYTLTHRAMGSIRIYSAEGRLVRTILEGTIEPGSHRIPFDGLDDSGRRLAAGGYFIKIRTDHVQAAGKLFVLR